MQANWRTTRPLDIQQNLHCNLVGNCRCTQIFCIFRRYVVDFPIDKCAKSWYAFGMKTNVKCDLHVHTTHCDGKNTPEEMVLAAIERGCPELGFSAHSPMPWDSGYTLRDPDGYADTVNALREKYSDKIKLYLGIEQDIFSETKTDRYEYVIGSVHYVLKSGTEISVDKSLDTIIEAVKSIYGGDPYAYVEDYYATVAEVYDRTSCDIIGHFDLLTKYIERDDIISIKHPRYRAARDAALERLLATPAIFEVNTGAIHRGYRTTPYPDDETLERIAASGKPIVVNSDSHSANTVDFLIDETADRLTAKGCKCLTSLTEVLKITRGI